MANSSSKDKAQSIAWKDWVLKMKCKLCESDNFSDLYEVDGRLIQKCSLCGLVRTKTDSFTNYQQYHRDTDYKKFEERFRNIFQKRFNRINRYKKGSRVLEIGCSTGLLLQIFQQAGWETWGVEPSHSYKTAQRRADKIIHSRFEEAALPENYFDVVVLNHVLEHVSDPVSILAKVKHVLKKGGIVYIDVPNFGSWGRQVEQQYWPLLLPYEHVHHFTPKTLSKTAEKAGLATIELKSWSGAFDVGNIFKYFIIPLKEKNFSFFSNLLDFPNNLVATIFDKGANLNLIAQKP